jgi:hypothetical protein
MRLCLAKTLDSYSGLKPKPRHLIVGGIAANTERLFCFGRRRRPKIELWSFAEMNLDNLARLIDGDAPAASEMLPGIDAVPAEVERLHEENQRLRNAIEIIEHTLATLRGEK